VRIITNPDSDLAEDQVVGGELARSTQTAPS